MKLIVGLGNPGKKYDGTRHNVGFECLQRLADEAGVARFQGKFQAEIAEYLLGSEKVVLMRPLTYMNLSGNSVRPCLDFFQLRLSDLLVICDDLALAPGKIRLRAQGSSGGQKGLQSIADRLGSNEFSRLRIGIGATPPQWETADYVLSRFSPEERTCIERGVMRAADAVRCWISEGIGAAMNRFNGDPLPPSPGAKSS